MCGGVPNRRLCWLGEGVVSAGEVGAEAGLGQVGEDARDKHLTLNSESWHTASQPGLPLWKCQCLLHLDSCPGSLESELCPTLGTVAGTLQAPPGPGCPPNVAKSYIPH